MTAASDTRATTAPWLVLAASLLFTLAATVFLMLSVHQRDEARFLNAVQGAEDRISQRLQIYLAALRGGTALFAASDSVTAMDFHQYAQRLDLQRYYPGVQGIGWSERIAAGLDGSVDERHTIGYLEPMDARNRVAIGFDMYSEPSRRAAMRRARDLGGPAITGPVTLVQEIFGTKQVGFLIYVPVYRGGGIPATVPERRESLRGFVYSPFRADDLFAGIFGSEEQPRVSFRVYDGTRPDSAALLHASALTPGHDPEFSVSRSFEVVGRQWTVVFASEPAFEAGSGRYLIPSMILAGLFFSLWLFVLARRQARARMQAEAANRAKAEFLSAMSHELRTPLNAIAGYVDLLDLGIRGPVNDTQREDLRRIKRAQEHLLALINDVLNFARVEAGRLELARGRVAVAPLLQELEQLMEPQVRAKDLRYETRPVDPDLCAWGDLDRIRQILLNLLTNAVKFSDQGGSLTVGAHREGAQVVVEVSDTGRGIPSDRLESVFDPFVQVDRQGTPSSQQGVGLGLAISRDLAIAMAGTLEGESEVGVGSTFRLTLPAAP